MDKYQHPTHNHVLGAPAGWDQNGVYCNALSVRKDMMGAHPVVVSHWRPTPTEIESLRAGAVIALTIVGYNMPPVALSLEPP